jgi:anti-anti-sigma regulatory factor
MDSTLEQNGNIVIRIQGSLSAYRVADLKDKMLSGLNTNDGLILDIDEVTLCDTLGIQLLFSAGKTAIKRNKGFQLTGSSEACREAALAIGLEPEDYLNSLKEA